MQKIQWMDKLAIGDEIVEVYFGIYKRIQVTGVSKKCVYANDRQYSKWHGGIHKGKRKMEEKLDWFLEPDIDATWKKRDHIRQTQLAYVQSFPYHKLKFFKLIPITA